MSPKSRGKALVIQSGGPTPVINESLAGIVEEAVARDVFDSVLGAPYGIDGLLEERFIDLGRQPKRLWGAVARTPGAALGSARRKLQPQQIGRLLETFSRLDIRYLFSIGGNDSAENAHGFAETAKLGGRPFTVIGVPKTIDNDLPETDHCPGYGSAARFVALATMGAGRDAEALGRSTPVTVLEVMGRNAGWVPAASALGKRDERDAPHLVLLPESPVEIDHVVDAVDGAVRRWGFALAVVCENLRDARGPLGSAGEPEYVDEFGHPYYPSPGQYLARLLSGHLKARVRFEKPGTIQRSMAACISRTDAAEARMAGRMAVRYVLEGKTDCMVTLVRELQRPYRCGTGLAPLAAIAAKERPLPQGWADAATGLPNQAFIDYALPLLGGPLPKFARLRGL